MFKNLTLSYRGLALGVLLFGAVLTPFIGFGGSKEIYVDRDNKGSADGSRNHPYRSIEKALDKAKDGTKVYVASGTYRENITIPKHVELIGRKDNPDKVVIEAKKDDRPTVEMKHDSKLSYVTVKDGRHGVRVLDDARAHLYDVKIKKSERDGIHIDKGSRSDKNRVLLDKVKISGSAKAGVFSERRHVVIINSEIVGNAGDGIDFTAEVKSWLEDNSITDNGGSGLKVVLDGASVYGSKNSIRRNGREGMEVSSYGASGNIGFKRVKFVDNGRYGVAKVARNKAGLTTFGQVTFDRTDFWGNKKGDQSPVLLIP